MPEPDLPGVDTGELTVDVVRDGEAVVVVASGEVDMLTAPILTDALDQATAQSNLLVLDFTGVTFLDSTGLGTIARAHQQVSEAGGSLRLAALRSNVARVLQITGLAEHWDVFPDRATALSGRS